MDTKNPLLYGFGGKKFTRTDEEIGVNFVVSFFCFARFSTKGYLRFIIMLYSCILLLFVKKQLNLTMKVSTLNLSDNILVHSYKYQTSS